MTINSNSSINSEVLAQLKSHVYDIIGCCQEVHRELGPWLNEYMYQEEKSLFIAVFSGEWFFIDRSFGFRKDRLVIGKEMVEVHLQQNLCR